MKKVFIFWFLIASLSLLAENILINDNGNSVQLVVSETDNFRLEYSLGNFHKEPVKIAEETYYQISLEKEPNSFETGAPALPFITRSLIIPDNALMQVNVIESEFVEFNLAVPPSKGILSRTIDPATVPYTFSDIYSTDAFYPAEVATLGEPYIMRDFRGITVKVQPFQYNPVTGILRVYTDIVLEVQAIGVDNRNIKLRSYNKRNNYFSEIYSNHFLNYRDLRYTTVEEQGRMIVICYPDFTDAIAPYVDWKNQKGIDCQLYTTADAGTTYTSIKSFIQAQYNLDDGLTFVQLVGDAAQIPAYNNDEDPSYSLLEGSDSYPEIFIGRFSGTTDAHIETQVERTIQYERDIASGTWLSDGLGIASNQGTGDQGEYDDEHMDNIRDKLLAYTYAFVDREYDSNGGSVSGAMNTLNSGVSIVNYCGHGSVTSWGNGAPLNISHVNALENDNTLPFIFSVACVVGQFMNTTCFAETWLRATNNTTDEPTGAIAFYGATINQSWSPPMRGQDHINDLLVGWNYYTGSAIDQKFTFGGLCFNGSCNMMDVYGTSGQNEFKHWTIFGDPSVMVRTMPPITMSISHNENIPTGSSSFTVNTDTENALVCLYDGSDIVASSYTDASGDVVLPLDPVPDTPQDLTLTITAYNKVTSVETVSVINATGPYIVIGSYSVASGGDDLIEPSETTYLSFTLDNIGGDSATNTEMTISEADPYISMLDASQSFGSIPGVDTATENDAFSFTVAPDIPDGHLISLNCAITCDEDGWDYQIELSAYNPPAITYSPDSFSMNLQPDEISTQTLSIGNTGGAELSYLISRQDADREMPGNDDYRIRDYCSASGGCDEYISRVQIGSIDNSSSCSGYADYTGLSTDLLMGYEYPITVTLGSPYNGDEGGLWIDWNQDGDFDDTNETIATNWEDFGPYTATITPPETALTGETRMRIRLAWYNTPTPCGTTSYGEVEDYTVNVVSAGPDWLTLNGNTNVSGSIPLGEPNEDIEIGFNTEEMGGGIYNAELYIESNDPDDPVVVIPVSLTIEAPPQAPANIILEIIGSEIQISWDHVAGANSYKIYSSDSPEGPFDLVETVSSGLNTRSYSMVEGKQFFRIVASTDSLPE